jgi:hypothetical protein
MVGFLEKKAKTPAYSYFPNPRAAPTSPAMVSRAITGSGAMIPVATILLKSSRCHDFLCSISGWSDFLMDLLNCKLKKKEKTIASGMKSQKPATIIGIVV